MLGDEIMKLRQQAERDAALDSTDGAYLPARAILALFICAEQLYEARENLSVLLDRLEDRGKL